MKRGEFDEFPIFSFFANFCGVLSFYQVYEPKPNKVTENHQTLETNVIPRLIKDE
jgi:hypothetical protein